MTASFVRSSKVCLPGLNAVKWATFEGGSLEQRRPWLGSHPTGPGPTWECRAARGHQARPEEVREPSWGTVQGATSTMLPFELSVRLVFTRQP